MRLPPLVLLTALAVPAAAQAPDAIRRPPASSVSGVVRDSIARQPLAGATVQIVTADSLARVARTAISDSLGRFTFSELPAGRYTLGFFHTMLDSLGLEPTLHEVHVSGERAVNADLAIPSVARVREAICGPRLAVDSRAGDSTDVVEVQLPPGGFQRRELFLGSPGTVVPPDTALRVDSLAPRPRAVRKGTGRLSGTVLASVDRRPLQGARVAISGGVETTSNERGEWTLNEAPVGTRMLDVRAIGYYPVRRQVDVLDGAPLVRLELSTLKAVLDTLRVTASRYDSRVDNGFEERRRSGGGLYLTRKDIERRNPLNTSDLFESVRGVRRTEGENPKFVMRGIFSPYCKPTFYLDGHGVYDLTAHELDAAIWTKDIVGIEIYSEPGSIPATFSQGLMGGLEVSKDGQVGMRDPCGSIVLWTR